MKHTALLYIVAGVMLAMAKGLPAIEPEPAALPDPDLGFLRLQMPEPVYTRTDIAIGAGSLYELDAEATGGE